MIESEGCRERRQEWESGEDFFFFSAVTASEPRGRQMLLHNWLLLPEHSTVNKTLTPGGFTGATELRRRRAINLDQISGAMAKPYHFTIWTLVLFFFYFLTFFSCQSAKFGIPATSSTLLMLSDV